MKVLNKKSLAYAGLLAALAVGAVALVVLSLGETPAEMSLRTKKEALVSRRKIREQKAHIAGKKALRRVHKVSDEQVRAKLEALRTRPTFDIDAADEAKLTELQRKTLADIRAALRENDQKRLLRLVQAMQASDEWPDGIPKSIKMAAIEALGWYGGDCMPELAGFLSDADPAIQEAANDELVRDFEEQISDMDIGDTRRAELLKQVARTITDVDSMELMMAELENLRPSKFVETAIYILENGNEAARNALPDNVEMITGSEDIKTVEQLQEWLKDNPDGADADEEFGPSKDE